MSEEEKKAIEDLKGINITYFVNGHECANFYLDEADKVSKEIELILNLIEKQQKEIEKSHQEDNGKLKVELEQEKEKNKELEKNNIDLKEKNRLIAENLSRSYISKDKIRKKLEHQNMLWNTPNRQKEYNQEFAEFLEELLLEEK